MKSTAIFSGTTEGRLLAESFAAAGEPVTVCVATEYGKEVMSPNPLIEVHVGRLDEQEMEQFLKERKTEVVFDATHPYAVIVSKNLKQAAAALGIEYKRLERDITSHTSDANVTYVKNIAEAVKILKASENRIFLTTGSKELKDFAELRDRLYVRVLPSIEALELCEQAGIEKSHIIAEQGPFTYEENLALLKRFDIGIMVTKASGRAGGYDEKIKAAQAAGIPVITIERNDSAAENLASKTDIIVKKSKESAATDITAKTKGKSSETDSAKRTVDLSSGKSWTSENASDRLHISVIGAGCGEDTLTLAAAREIKNADLIIGSKRLLDYSIVRNNSCKKVAAFMPDDIISAIKAYDCRKAVVFFSGDTGFYSGAAKFLERLHMYSDSKEQTEDTENENTVMSQSNASENELPSATLSTSYEVEVFPGISSVQALSAAVHLPYNDAAIHSFHGRELNLSQIIEIVEKNHISYFLFSGKEDAEKILSSLKGKKVRIYTGIDFGSENQQVVTGTDRLPDGKLYIMVVENLCEDL